MIESSAASTTEAVKVERFPKPQLVPLALCMYLLRQQHSELSLFETLTFGSFSKTIQTDDGKESSASYKGGYV
ncbi:hypothetical protein RRG08_021508 [Elysia crispata]|uniref:Uncharacterized protein n=1 Tax=Elysia crispata TaxID=231223 RepID=A0AAE1EDY7_9GAST|nr:hypothetical protein RRG08_021508 [Elysia crispata]